MNFGVEQKFQTVVELDGKEILVEEVIGSGGKISITATGPVGEEVLKKVVDDFQSMWDVYARKFAEQMESLLLGPDREDGSNSPNVPVTNYFGLERREIGSAWVRPTPKGLHAAFYLPDKGHVQRPPGSGMSFEEPEWVDVESLKQELVRADNLWGFSFLFPSDNRTNDEDREVLNTRDPIDSARMIRRAYKNRYVPKNF